jgi:hypothetical protein
VAEQTLRFALCIITAVTDERTDVVPPCGRCATIRLGPDRAADFRSRLSGISLDGPEEQSPDGLRFVGSLFQGGRAIRSTRTGVLSTVREDGRKRPLWEPSCQWLVPCGCAAR